MNLVRDSQKVWPYCDECGCRLDYDIAEAGVLMFFHFGHDSWSENKDARGHHCAKTNLHWVVDESIVYVGEI